MKIRFLICGFLIWVVIDFLFLQLIIPGLLMVADIHEWLNIWLLAFHLAPMYVIGTFLISFFVIFIFSWASSQVWEFAYTQYRKRKLK